MLSLQYPLILASKSPRRAQLLREAGIPFEIKTKEVEEIYPDDLSVDQVAQYLAVLKAESCRSFIQRKDDLLLAADSVVILGDTIFGKPKDKADAFHTLRALSGQVHQVTTGVCLLSQNEKVAFSESSKVHFEELTDEEIEYYIEQYQPYDKAGSYAIQEWIGLCKISKIEGTYANIMGLPVDKVYRVLSAWQ
ncbi:MAG: Maf family nucleotide pyrophosphatase [Bacteroidota bacterium]